VADPSEVIDFWFAPDTKEKWFKPTPEFDQAIRDRFGALHDQAAAGALGAWEATPEGCLALLILLDQFPRNMFRGDAGSFATDATARAVANRAIEAGHDRATAKERRDFFYLPFEHSEDLEDQHRAVALFAAHANTGDNVKWAERHLAVIERFGRFPHRNEVLGRDSTAEEIDYLEGRDEPF
jgi:uncharacterized protein (DUF924 family)